jgi:hypothetical protein
MDVNYFKMKKKKVSVGWASISPYHLLSDKVE